MNATGGFACADGSAILVKWLKDAVACRKNVCLRSQEGMDTGLRPRSLGLIEGQNAQVREEVSDAAPTDRKRIDRHCSAAAHFGSHRNQASPAGSGGRGPRVAEV